MSAIERCDQVPGSFSACAGPDHMAISPSIMATALTRAVAARRVRLRRCSGRRIIASLLAGGMIAGHYWYLNHLSTIGWTRGWIHRTDDRSGRACLKVAAGSLDVDAGGGLDVRDIDPYGAALADDRGYQGSVGQLGDLRVGGAVSLRQARRVNRVMAPSSEVIREARW